MNELRKRALKHAIVVFGFSMLIGRIAAPIVIAVMFGPVEDFSQIRTFVWCCLGSGTIVCALLGWLQYRQTMRRGGID